MPVPDFQTIMLPLLLFAADGIEHSMTDAREALALQRGTVNVDCGAGMVEAFAEKRQCARRELLR